MRCRQVARDSNARFGVLSRQTYPRVQGQQEADSAPSDLHRRGTATDRSWGRTVTDSGDSTDSKTRFAASRAPIDYRLFTPKVAVTGRKSCHGDHMSGGSFFLECCQPAGSVSSLFRSMRLGNLVRIDKQRDGPRLAGNPTTGKSLLYELEDDLMDRRCVVRNDRWRSVSAGARRGVVRALSMNAEDWPCFSVHLSAIQIIFLRPERPNSPAGAGFAAPAGAAPGSARARDARQFREMPGWSIRVCSCRTRTAPPSQAGWSRRR